MFAFFHVGDDCRLPVRLVQSIRQFHPDAPVYMVTDADTPTLKGVIRHEVEIDREALMLSRTLGYADLGLADPTLYLDTDMALNRPISLRSALGDASAGFCRRSYHRDAPFNGFSGTGRILTSTWNRLTASSRMSAALLLPLGGSGLH